MRRVRSRGYASGASLLCAICVSTSLAQEAPDAFDELDARGEALVAKDNHLAALDVYRELLDRARRGGERRRELEALSRLVYVYYQLREYDEAARLAETKLRLMGPEIELATELRELAGLGDMLFNAGRATRAREVYDRLAHRAMDGRDGFWMVTAFQGLAVSDAALGNLEEARQNLHVALQFLCAPKSGCPPPRLDDLYGLRFALLDLFSLTMAWEGRYGNAIDIQDQIRELGGAEYADHLGAFLLRQGRFREAEHWLRRYQARPEQVLRDTRSVEGELARDEWLRLNLELSAATSDYLQEALVGQGRTLDALYAAEAGKARALDTLLAERRGSDPRGPAGLELQALARRRRSTLVEYSLVSPEISGLTSSTRFRLGEADRRAPRVPSQLFIWVVPPEGEVRFRSVALDAELPSRGLADLIGEARTALGAPGRGIAVVEDPKRAARQRSALRRLHQLLIEPIEDLLPEEDGARVTLIPDEGLYLVPFAALPDAKGRQLVERATISIAPAIHVLETLARSARDPAVSDGLETLLVGNPTMPAIRLRIDAPPQPLPPLPGAEAEVAKIAKLLKAKPVTGPAATEELVRARLPAARIVHFASHGILDQLLGLQSAVALAPTEQDDGFLTMREVFSMKTDAELVVLSACDTGRGEITGDGVAGIARSFMAAGAASTVVSLWSVPDAPTADLMLEFYRHWTRHRDPARALREAMLVVKRSHPNPRDWAGFAVIGGR